MKYYFAPESGDSTTVHSTAIWVPQVWNDNKTTIRQKEAEPGNDSRVFWKLVTSYVGREVQN